jgi:DNA-binding MarR family transcriptional regulator
MAQATGQSVGYDELATLKLLGLSGALDGQEKVSCSALAERLDASDQTASRRLQRLDDAGYVEREIVSDGQWVQVTPEGESALRREYAGYQRLFERDASIDLQRSADNETGVVTLSVTWDGLAAVEGDTLVVTEPFASGFTPDRTFVLTAPEGYSIATVTPQADTSDEGRATWEPNTDLSGFTVELEPDPRRSSGRATPITSPRTWPRGRSIRSARARSTPSSSEPSRRSRGV